MQKGIIMDKANINQPLDLQEATRRDDVFIQMLEINRQLSEVAVFPSLLWAWTFDILKDIHENWQNPEFNDEIVPEGVTLKEIFNKFWEDVDGLGFTMDQGGEILEECILDWMRESGFLVALDDDSWLDERGTE